MAKEVVRQHLPMLAEGGRGAATDDAVGRDRHYLPDTPEEDPYQAGHRTCAGCGPAIEYRWVLKAAGQDTVVAGPTGCMYVANSTYLCTPYTVPWAHTPIARGGSFTAGLAAGYEALIRKGRHAGPYPNIITMSGDECLGHRARRHLRRALPQPRRPVHLLRQRVLREHRDPGLAHHAVRGDDHIHPVRQGDTGRHRLPPKNLAKMMAEGHPHCYVATATVGYPVDLINKTRKGLNHRGAAFMHCFTPCQKGWVYQTSMTVEIGRRVVEAGLFPVWEYDPEQRKYHYFHPPVQRPVTDYLAMQGRFGHMLAEHIATTQQQANRNWETIGMDVPAELRAGEDPEHHRRLRDETYSMPLNRGVGA
jgi:pyruvate ferredoxin oxidoreductase beta subunit/oxalate oxidoreductase subunit beta